MSIRITLRPKINRAGLAKEIEAKEGPILEKVKQMFTESELAQLLHDAMNLVIYDQPIGEYYRRTRTLYNAVKTVRGPDGLAVYVDNDAFPNGTYAGFTAVFQGKEEDRKYFLTSGEGYFTPAWNMIFDHVISSLKNTGKFKITREERSE